MNPDPELEKILDAHTFSDETSYSLPLREDLTVQLQQWGATIRREEQIWLLKEEISDIDEALVLWRKNERKHHSWLLAWLEDDRRKLTELERIAILQSQLPKQDVE